MSVASDPFDVLVVEPTGDGQPAVGVLPGAATARFHGFGVDEQPLVVGLPTIPAEIVAARSTVPLVRAHVGATVVVVFEENDVRRPIVVGILQDPGAMASATKEPPQRVTLQIDDDTFAVSAEREIVLRCGDASITLTRAGKVLIKGTYVVSRSSGYNKIKGAAVDIN